ncbi:AsmA-like protein [Paucimonas lemoignei]|uniref:AsmA-like protein n=1 Tax=Paucimonas lemoignei TaxID=29443 RepID=A0A4R3HSY2_PAULE|nr:AsmA-like C-terminal region-containing protein [Paucimonas lemoignei]TCS33743.1 AsmA-like protein [Paucimonas lemoignei]
MDNYTIFTKTAKGLGEALGKTKNLSREHRKILKEIDGKASFENLIDQLGMDDARLEKVISKLLAEDYIREFGSSAPPGTQSTGETVFGLTAPATIEVANSQLTIGDFFRAMEEPDVASGAHAGNLDFRSLGMLDADSARRAREEQVAQIDQTRRAIEEEARRITEQMQRQAAESARRESERLALAAAEQARLEAEAKAKQEAELARQQALLQEQLRARQEAEEQARRAEQERARKEAEEAERQARIKAEQEARRLAEEAARREEQERQRREAEERARQQAEEDARKRAEAERQAQQAAEAKARKEAEAQARREAEEEARRQEEAARRAAEEAERLAQEQARIKAWEAARRAAEELAKREAEAAAKAETERQAKLKAEEEARLAAAAQARLQAEEETRRAAEEQARREAEEQARLQAEAEAHRAAEEKARREAEEQARQEARERARKEAEEAARLKAEDKARQKAEAKARKEAEAQAKREAREQARREAEEKARQEAERKAQQAAEARSKKEAEQQAKREAKEKARQAAEEAARLKAEEAARVKAAKEAEKEAEKAAKIAAKAEVKAAVGADADKAAAPASPAPDDTIQPAMASEEPASRRAVRIALPSLNLGRLVRTGAVAVAALSVIGLAAVHVMPFTSRLALLQKEASAQFGQPVRIGGLNLALLPQPHWRLQEVAIGENKQIVIPQVKARASLASLFDGTMQFTSIELVSPAIDEEGLAWILFGPTSGTSSGAPTGAQADTPWQAAMLTASDIRLRTPRLPLPVFDGSVEIDDKSGWRKIALNAAAEKLHIDLIQKDGKLQFEFTANDLLLPFGATQGFDSFNASGAIARDGLEIDKFTGVVYDGTLSGNAVLRWKQGWNLKGEAQAKRFAPAKLVPTLMQGGALDGNFKFAMRADEADKLFAAPQVRGSFNASSGTLLGIDMASQIMGQAGSGRTAFNEIDGDFILDGGKLKLAKMHMAAGLLSAAGDAALDADGRLDGQINMDLRTATRQAHGIVKLGGTVGAPKFSR